MQNNEELKYEPTTSEPKTTQIVYAFAHQFSESERNFLTEVGKQEGVHLQVFEQQAFSEDQLSKLIRGMSVPVLGLVFSVNDEQKQKIINTLHKSDVRGLVTIAQINDCPPELLDISGQTHTAHVLWQATRPLHDWFEHMHKELGLAFKFDKAIPSRLSGLAGDYDPVPVENLPLTYEFEEAIRMIKTGDVAMRPLHAPVDSFVSKTDGSQLPSNKFWSKYNKAVAEQRPNKTLKVNSSFTKFLGGMDGVTMGWVPTNEEMWSKWVIEGTALYPSQIQLSADHVSLYIRYDLYRGRSVLDKATKFAGPFNLAYDTIFPAIRNCAKVGFLTNNLDADIAAYDQKLITVILNDMIDFHENSNDEFAHSNIVVSHEDADAQPYFVVEHTINFASDEKYTHESAALWNELKAEEIEVLIVDLDAFEDHSLKDDILKQLNWLSEQQDNFTWVALSIKEDVDIVNEVELIDLGDGPDQQ